MVRKTVFLAITLGICVQGYAAAEVFRFWAQQDTWANEANPTANYGNNSYLTVRDTSGLAEAFLRFNEADLVSLQGQSILSARLRLFQYQGTYEPGDQVSLHNILTDWQEAAPTWQQKPAYAAEPVSGLSFDTGVNVWREWGGLERIVSGWLSGNSYGLALENNRDGVCEELYARFYSSEYSVPELRPYLEVEAIPVSTPEPVSSALFVLGVGTFLLHRRRQAQGA